MNQTFKDFHVVICNDGSNDNSSKIISDKYSSELVTIIEGNGNLWWAGGLNKCVDHVIKIANDNDLVYTLNNDTELYKNTLEIIHFNSTLEPKAIIGTCNVFYSDSNLIEPSAFIFKNNRLVRVNKWGEKITSSENKIIKVSALSGKGVLIPITVFKNIGLYNNIKLPHYHADTEFTIRANRAGYKILINYSARLKSHQNLSGLGSRTSKPNLLEFVKSFNTLKSPHHLTTLINWNKTLYSKNAWLHIILDLFGITIGFLKRLFTFSKNE